MDVKCRAVTPVRRLRKFIQIIVKVYYVLNKRSMGPVSLTCFHLQIYLKFLLYKTLFLKGVAICDPKNVI